MRTVIGSYEIDDDPARIDTDAAIGFLLAEAYWGRTRAPTMIARQIREAWRVVGAYDAARACLSPFDMP